MTPQDEISINDPRAYSVYCQNMLKMAVEGLIEIKRFDGYYGEFEIKYKGYHDIIRYEEWQLKEIFKNEIPTIPVSYEEFKRRIIMYLEEQIRIKEEERRKKEINKKLGEDLLNFLKPYIEEYEKTKNIKVTPKIEGEGTAAIILYIKPNTPEDS
jgi:hypothetical protein